MTTHVLERFIRCSFTFQARCFSFEFRPFDLSPCKYIYHGMVYFRLIEGIVFTEQSFSSAFAYDKLDV